MRGREREREGGREGGREGERVRGYLYLEHASWLEGPVNVSGQTGDVDASWNVDTLS